MHKSFCCANSFVVGRQPYKNNLHWAESHDWPHTYPAAGSTRQFIHHLPTASVTTVKHVNNFPLVLLTLRQDLRSSYVPRKMVRLAIPLGAVTAAVVGASIGYLIATTTRQSLPQDDEIWTSKIFTRLNPHRNPTMGDICQKRIPLAKIRPDLRNNESALATEFCRGIWSGYGMYFFQYLKYSFG